jgi:AcrR family transcriptional regulator
MTDSKNKRDPIGTRRRILGAATEEFTRAGLSGARVDQIARKAQTNERMLYYYFGSKEQLFTAVLEQVFASFCEIEHAVAYSELEPLSAMTTLAHTIWQYFRDHPEVLRLMNNENMHEARYLMQSPQVPRAIVPVIAVIESILGQGERAGLFRADVDAMLLLITICALGYYVVSNRHTIRASMGCDYTQGAAAEAAVAMHTEMLLSYLCKP